MVLLKYIFIGLVLLAMAGSVSAADYFLADFESDLAGFTIDNTPSPGHGLWHRTNQCAATLSNHSGSWVLYYGNDTTCNYVTEDPPGTPVANQGFADSPAIDLTAATGTVLLEFKYCLHTQNVLNLDVASVQISANGGAFQTLRTQYAGLIDSENHWHKAVADLTAWVGSSIRIRFVFDSVDNQLNNFPGFAVDDVRVYDGLESIPFDNAALQTAVENYFKNEMTPPIENPTKADMLKLTSFSAAKLNIDSLSGFEYAVNLQTVDFGDNQIVDLAPLAQADQLITLYLGNNQLADAEILENFQNLSSLSFKNNNITDISACANLMFIEWVDLQNNHISDIAPLGELTSLMLLFMDGNPLNTPAYCQWLSQIQNNNLSAIITYDPNPNVLTSDCSCDLPELALWLNDWLNNGCSAANNWCSDADLDHNGQVDAADFAVIADLWLQ